MTLTRSKSPPLATHITVPMVIPLIEAGVTVATPGPHVAGLDAVVVTVRDRPRCACSSESYGYATRAGDRRDGSGGDGACIGLDRVPACSLRTVAYLLGGLVVIDVAPVLAPELMVAVNS